MTVTELVKEAHNNAVDKGFWSVTNDSIYTERQLAKIALIMSELGECVEAIRSNEPNTNLPEELADVCIRVFDLAGFLKIDLEQEITDKMLKNRTRPYKHGKRA